MTQYFCRTFTSLLLVLKTFIPCWFDEHEKTNLAMVGRWQPDGNGSENIFCDFALDPAMAFNVSVKADPFKYLPRCDLSE